MWVPADVHWAGCFCVKQGLSFGQWRQQLRLQEAVKLLGEGKGVTEVALILGYRSPSAFVAMFRKALGKPPKQYCVDLTSGSGES